MPEESPEKIIDFRSNVSSSAAAQNTITETVELSSKRWYSFSSLSKTDRLIVLSVTGAVTVIFILVLFLIQSPPPDQVKAPPLQIPQLKK